MITDYNSLSQLGNIVSKSYAPDMFRLLMAYKDISATEAASRLDLHVQTAQEFLETLVKLKIVSKVEVSEGKRPYFRYSMSSTGIEVNVDLRSLVENIPKVDDIKIREKKNSGAKFNMARGQEYFGSLSWFGEGRRGKVNQIKLTENQGRFLYYLPFPDGTPLSVNEIISQANLNPDSKSEILDLVYDLIKKGIISKT